MERCPPPAVRPVRAGAPGRPDDEARRTPTASDTTPLDVPRPATRPIPSPRRRPHRARPGAAPGPPKLTVTRVAAARSRELTAAGVRRVRAASRADGAGESGLTHLLWVNALHMAGDAMVAVSLAGTLFFAATTDARRSNVALYLLVTMAPFAAAGARHRPRPGPAAARPPLGARGQPVRPRGRSRW